MSSFKYGYPSNLSIFTETHFLIFYQKISTTPNEEDKKVKLGSFFYLLPKTLSLFFIKNIFSEGILSLFTFFLVNIEKLNLKQHKG